MDHGTIPCCFLSLIIKTRQKRPGFRFGNYHLCTPALTNHRVLLDYPPVVIRTWDSYFVLSMGHSKTDYTEDIPIVSGSIPFKHGKICFTAAQSNAGNDRVLNPITVHVSNLKAFLFKKTRSDRSLQPLLSRTNRPWSDYHISCWGKR